MCYLMGVSVALLRCFFSVPGHIGYGIIMGYFIGLAYKNLKNNNKIYFYMNTLFSILIPTIFHGLYDFTLMYGAARLNLFPILLIFVLDLVVIIYAIKKLKEVAVASQKLDSNNIDNLIGFKLLGLELLVAVVIFGMFLM